MCAQSTAQIVHELAHDVDRMCAKHRNLKAKTTGTTKKRRKQKGRALAKPETEGFLAAILDAGREAHGHELVSRALAHHLYGLAIEALKGLGDGAKQITPKAFVEGLLGAIGERIKAEQNCAWLEGDTEGQRPPSLPKSKANAGKSKRTTLQILKGKAGQAPSLKDMPLFGIKGDDN